MRSTARSGPDGDAGATDTPQVDRFALTPRVVHAVVGVLMMICLVTASFLYIGSLALLVGHRHVVELIHVWSGIAMPVPLLIGLVAGTYRDDLRRLNRFRPSDWAWLRSRSRRDGQIRVGKFNAGQKLNACLSAGSIGVLLGTGIVMYVPDAFALSWRSGATFAHDWFALAVGFLVLGHLTFALGDRDALRGMVTGRVPMAWARREHAAWADEADEVDPAAGNLDG